MALRRDGTVKVFGWVFSLSSVLLAIFFGAAAGNVIRGVPLRPDHYFFVALWTDFRVGANPAVLDWYTVLTAVLALVALMMHGALYVALKTEGTLRERMRTIAGVLWPVLVGLTVLSLIATLSIRPQLLDNYKAFAAGWLIPIVVAASLAGTLLFRRSGADRNAFLSSCAYLVAMLGGAAFALYPALLPGAPDPRYSITIHNAAAGTSSLSIGLVWWSVGMLIAIGYFVFVYRMFAGKVRADGGDHGY